MMTMYYDPINSDEDIEVSLCHYMLIERFSVFFYLVGYNHTHSRNINMYQYAVRYRKSGYCPVHGSCYNITSSLNICLTGEIVSS